MTKRFFAILLAAALSSVAFAQNEPSLKLSGEAKSGIYWEQEQQVGKDSKAEVKLHNKDDAGGGAGRFRLNMDYDNGNNFGMRLRIDWERWAGTNEGSQLDWKYAFGYGNFFDEQLTISVGKLGGSPWGTGGPEMWRELEQGFGGIRVEYKPAFIPEQYGKVNIGFVLNSFNSDRDQGGGEGGTTIPVSLMNILRESVIGVSYTHDYFMARIAYRFDDEMDAISENKITGGKGEDEIVYRVEERIINDYLPGFKVWALGYLFGVSAARYDAKMLQFFRNWLFAEYEPPVLGNMPTPFTAQIRFGLDYIDRRSDFYVKPSFYWNFFNKLLSVGAAFTWCQDYGDGKLYEGSPYHYIEVEPKIQVNFTSSYVAFAYNFKQEYMHPWTDLKEGKDPLKQTQWMNLRFCIYY